MRTWPLFSFVLTIIALQDRLLAVLGYCFTDSRSSSSSSREQRHDDVDDDDEDEEAAVYGDEATVSGRRGTESARTGSVARRVAGARNVRSLLRAVQRAAVRVNPRDPDAFLQSLQRSLRPPGRTELLDEEDSAPELCDQEVQTDEDLATAARLSWLRREMVSLHGQQRLAEVMTYVMASVSALLMLLFTGRLWTAMQAV